MHGLRPARRGRHPVAWWSGWMIGLCTLLACFPALSIEPPDWPLHAAAERGFIAGHVMFLERRSGRWHAWVLPGRSHWTRPLPSAGDGSGWRGQVLDFFSGVLVDAELHEDEIGHARPVFFSVEGVHAPTPVGDRAAVSHGLLRDPQYRGLRFDDDSRLDALPLEGCATRLMVVRKHDSATQAPRWSRLVLRRSPPTAECPHGRWSSQVHAVLDLHDGTFLAVLDDRVLRLREDGLVPVGTGTDVRVVDADTVIAILSAGGDMHERLNAELLPDAAPARADGHQGIGTAPASGSGIGSGE